MAAVSAKISFIHPLLGFQYWLETVWIGRG
jgi:hypothetical protein